MTSFCGCNYNIGTVCYLHGLEGTVRAFSARKAEGPLSPSEAVCLHDAEARLALQRALYERACAEH